MRKSFEELMDEFTGFSLETYKKATAKSCLIKLRQEIAEIEANLDQYDLVPEHEIAEEYADALMCLLSSAALAGFDTETLRASFARKLLINRKRKWILNPDNTYSHDKF